MKKQKVLAWANQTFHYFWQCSSFIWNSSKKKKQISCYQKLGIGGGFGSPEKISPKKISQTMIIVIKTSTKATEKNRNQISITCFISSATIANNQI